MVSGLNKKPKGIIVFIIKNVTLHQCFIEYKPLTMLQAVSIKMIEDFVFRSILKPSDFFSLIKASIYGAKQFTKQVLFFITNPPVPEYRNAVVQYLS
jgi:hypothetical protein